MAANFKDMEKRVKKLSKKAKKSKANEADLEALIVEMHSELEEKATTEALHELAIKTNRGSHQTDDKRMNSIIRNCTSDGNSPRVHRRGGWRQVLGDRKWDHGHRETENNIIIYQVDEDIQSSYLTQEAQWNAIDKEKVKKIMKIVTGSEGEEKIS